MPIRVPSRTLTFKAGGYASLSPDLAISESFAYQADRRNKKLILLSDPGLQGSRLKLWKSNSKRSRSRTMSMNTAMSQIGLDAKQLEGQQFDVVVQGSNLIIKFGRTR